MRRVGKKVGKQKARFVVELSHVSYPSTPSLPEGSFLALELERGTRRVLSTDAISRHGRVDFNGESLEVHATLYQDSRDNTFLRKDAKLTVMHRKTASSSQLKAVGFIPLRLDKYVSFEPVSVELPLQRFLVPDAAVSFKISCMLLGDDDQDYSVCSGLSDNIAQLEHDIAGANGGTSGRASTPPAGLSSFSSTASSPSSPSATVVGAFSPQQRQSYGLSEGRPSHRRGVLSSGQLSSTVGPSPSEPQTSPSGRGHQYSRSVNSPRQLLGLQAQGQGGGKGLPPPSPRGVMAGMPPVSPTASSAAALADGADGGEEEGAPTSPGGLARSPSGRSSIFRRGARGSRGGADDLGLDNPFQRTSTKPPGGSATDGEDSVDGGEGGGGVGEEGREPVKKVRSASRRRWSIVSDGLRGISSGGDNAEGVAAAAAAAGGGGGSAVGGTVDGDTEGEEDEASTPTNGGGSGGGGGGGGGGGVGGPAGRGVRRRFSVSNMKEGITDIVRDISSPLTSPRNNSNSEGGGGAADPPLTPAQQIKAAREEIASLTTQLIAVKLSYAQVATEHGALKRVSNIMAKRLGVKPIETFF